MAEVSKRLDVDDFILSIQYPHRELSEKLGELRNRQQYDFREWPSKVRKILEYVKANRDQFDDAEMETINTIIRSAAVWARFQRDGIKQLTELVENTIGTFNNPHDEYFNNIEG